MGGTRREREVAAGAAGGGAQEMRVAVIRAQRSDDAVARDRVVSKALDPFTGWSYGNGPKNQIEPRAEPDFLADQLNRSQSLKACANAIATNVYQMGFTLVPRRKPSDEAEEQAAKDEADRLNDFFATASPESSWMEEGFKFGYDKAGIGYGIFEVIRDRGGRLAGLKQHASRHFRMTPLDEKPTEARFNRWNSRTGTWETQPYERRFRRYVQNVAGRLRYFKELGDPRNLDMETGEYRKELPEERQAAEVIFDCQYDPTTPYGLPVWVPLWDDTESDRNASLTTKQFLEDGTPLALIFTPNATVTGSSRKKLEDAFLDAKATGHARTKVVIMDALPVEAKGAPGSTPSGMTAATPQVVKLGDLQQGDALYRLFRDDHHKRIRRAFRLPGLFLGEDDQANYATANIQMQIAETQVFAPLRMVFDNVINSRILPELDAKWWKYQSNGPMLQDNTSWVEVVRLGIDSGAIPDYKTLRRILSEVLGYDLPSGDKNGDLSEWEQMPPGFVKMLFQVIQGFPGYEDLADTLSGVAEPSSGDSGESEASRSKTARRGSARVTDRMVDRAVELMLAVAPKVRARLASLAGGE